MVNTQQCKHILTPIEVWKCQFRGKSLKPNSPTWFHVRDGLWFACVALKRAIFVPKLEFGTMHEEVNFSAYNLLAVLERLWLLRDQLKSQFVFVL